LQNGAKLRGAISLEAGGLVTQWYTQVVWRHAWEQFDGIPREQTSLWEESGDEPSAE
jgi:hypothetical protein